MASIFVVSLWLCFWFSAISLWKYLLSFCSNSTWVSQKWTATLTAVRQGQQLPQKHLGGNRDKNNWAIWSRPSLQTQLMDTRFSTRAPERKGDSTDCDVFFAYFSFNLGCFVGMGKGRRTKSYLINRNPLNYIHSKKNGASTFKSGSPKKLLYYPHTNFYS